MINLKKENKKLAAHADEPDRILQWARMRFAPNLVMASSMGIDASVLLRIATKVVPEIPVILINTRHLPDETCQYSLELSAYFKLNLKVYTPLISKAESDKLVALGKEGEAEYSKHCKVEPLQRALRELSARAIMFGVRSDQTETRAKLNFIEKQSNGLYRIHPILAWNKERIKEYQYAHELPRHPLADTHDSVGDTHNTFPGEDRTGRLLTDGECGIHLDIGKDI